MQKKLKNIALFGGSFDPPHLGHLAVIKAALKELEISKLFIMPAFLSPFKKSSLFSAQTRFFWLKELCENFEKVEVSDYEISQNRPVITLQSVNFLAQKYNIKGEIFLIIGADILGTLSRWEGILELSKKVKLVIAKRAKYEISSEILKSFQNNFKSDFKILQIAQNIASSDIRAALKNNDFKNPALDFVPKQILEQILSQNLQN